MPGLKRDVRPVEVYDLESGTWKFAGAAYVKEKQPDPPPSEPAVGKSFLEWYEKWEERRQLAKSA